MRPPSPSPAAPAPWLLSVDAASTISSGNDGIPQAAAPIACGLRPSGAFSVFGGSSAVYQRSLALGTVAGRKEPSTRSGNRIHGNREDRGTGLAMAKRRQLYLAMCLISKEKTLISIRCTMLLQGRDVCNWKMHPRGKDCLVNGLIRGHAAHGPGPVARERRFRAVV